MNKVSPWERETTEEQRAYIGDLLARARAAMETLKKHGAPEDLFQCIRTPRA
jgi:hypothetical protein